MWLGWKRHAFPSACLRARWTKVNAQLVVRKGGGMTRYIVGDLNKCEVYPNWHEQAQDNGIWHGWIKAAAEDVNKEMEIAEQSKKDELKQRREAVNQEQTLSDWRCSEQGCWKKLCRPGEPHQTDPQQSRTVLVWMCSLWEVVSEARPRHAYKILQRESRQERLSSITKCVNLPFVVCTAHVEQT